MTTDHPTTQPTPGPAPTGHACDAYEIRVHGRLAARWTAWFDGLDITPEADGTTVIRGAVVDQAALHGLLQRLRDIGIPLVSLTRLPPDAPAGRTALHDHPTPHTPTGEKS